MKHVEEPEINYRYPHQWIEEYKRNGIGQCWYEDYPELFYGKRGVCLGSGDNKTSNLSTYALMYLLKRNEGVESLTYFRLASKGKSRDGRREALQEYLREFMGIDSFEGLRKAIQDEGLKGFTGEPDLFCWRPADREWFFAEAKGDDRLTDTQRHWFAVCRETLPGVIIKVCSGQSHGSFGRCGLTNKD